jgi:hypothetical protein
LQQWFTEIIEKFPPLNGPLVTGLSDSTVNDHCIGRYVVYSAFTSSQGESGYHTGRLSPENMVWDSMRAANQAESYCFQKAQSGSETNGEPNNSLKSDATKPRTLG